MQPNEIISEKIDRHARKTCNLLIIISYLHQLEKHRILQINSKLLQQQLRTVHVHVRKIILKSDGANPR